MSEDRVQSFRCWVSPFNLAYCSQKNGGNLIFALFPLINKLYKQVSNITLIMVTLKIEERVYRELINLETDLFNEKEKKFSHSDAIQFLLCKYKVKQP